MLFIWLAGCMGSQHGEGGGARPCTQEKQVQKLAKSAKGAKARNSWVTIVWPPVREPTAGLWLGLFDNHASGSSSSRAMCHHVP